ncbi:MAG: hypothetical protein L6V93_05830 [Clostridiales bacterium]|nr:MAG: hypothetical protein L6V93_05830 [Clostridiales bacterium]
MLKQRAKIPLKARVFCTALCKIDNGTYEDIENALTLYADTLGIDLSYADEKECYRCRGGKIY